MDQDLIQQILARACGDTSLYFQIVQQDPYLYVFINRPAESQLDYTHLSKIVGNAIAQLNLPNIEYLSLSSRVMGEVEPDWETCLELSTKATIQPQNDSDSASLNLIPRDSSEVAAQASATRNSTESVLEIAPAAIPQSQESETSAKSCESLSSIDLSQFCFIRNKLLLTSQLTAPPKKIIETILFFHNLSALEKQMVLPSLEKIFKSRGSAESEGFSEEIQKWLQSIAQNDSENFRKAAIWLSRYCLDSEKTLAEVNVVIEAKKADLQAKTEKSAITPQKTGRSGELLARKSIKQTNKNTDFSQPDFNFKGLIKACPAWWWFILLFIPVIQVIALLVLVNAWIKIWRVNWKLATFVLILLLVFFGSIFGLVISIMISSVPYKRAVAQVRQSPLMIENLGEPISIGWFPQGSIEIANDSGLACLLIPVSGSRAKGKIYVDAKRQRREWSFRQLVVVIEGRDEPIVLATPPSNYRGSLCF